MFSLLKAAAVASLANDVEFLHATTELEVVSTVENAVPASVFNLTNWKLQVPYSSTGSFTSGTATEIKQPALNTY